ncbi:MAG: MmgE/PrpD family protein [Rhizobiaceae bacterium]|nr:MmgE/PrpD family protein [Rhizobiaceae bacterium]
MMKTASADLAEFVVSCRSIPAAVQHEAVRSITNGFATGLAGSGDAALRHASTIARRFSSGEVANVMGHVDRFDILTASFLNAIAINVFDFDDTHPGTIVHPTAPVLPPLLALAQSQKITGADFLEAFAIGVDVECRVANAVSPGHYRRGWHITATCGVFGAAAATGRILGLDAAQMLNAFGIASAQASGLVETLGTMAKSVGVGNAARNGIVAALLAQDGMNGPAMPLEGPRGFLHVTADRPDIACLTNGLGQDWELLKNTYKPYPCGVVLNPVIEATLLIARRPEFDPHSVISVTVHGHPLLSERADRANPADGREAQVSAQHAVAVSLLLAKAGLPEFSDAAVADARVVALRDKVTVKVDPSLPVGASEIRIELQGGARITERVDQARGDSARPLSDVDLETKLRDLSAFGVPSLDPEPLLAAIRALPQAEDAGPLTRLAAL